MSYKNIIQDYSLTYDDISLIPNQISAIEHRAKCDTKSEFLGLNLDVPIIASPMNTVCGGKMAKSLSDLSYLGINLDKEINSNDKLGERLISSGSSKVPVCIVKVDEELIIARETYNLVKS